MGRKGCLPSPALPDRTFPILTLLPALERRAVSFSLCCNAEGVAPGLKRHRHSRAEPPVALDKGPMSAPISPVTIAPPVPRSTHQSRPARLRQPAAGPDRITTVEASLDRPRPVRSDPSNWWLGPRPDRPIFVLQQLPLPSISAGSIRRGSPGSIAPPPARHISTARCSGSSSQPTLRTFRMNRHSRLGGQNCNSRPHRYLNLAVI